MRKRLLNIVILMMALSSCSEEKKSLNDIADTNLGADETYSNVYNVGFLISDGVYNTELTSPYDIFQHTIYRDSIKPMNVFTVAQVDTVVTTFEGLRLLPDYTFKNAPDIDILVVPSAEHHLDTDLENEELIAFVKSTGEKAMYVTSHCDVAFVLAQAGLLDGKVSTTFPSDIDLMRKTFPDLDVRKDVLFVHDHNVITSAGGARSFEAALYLTDMLYGKKIAQSLAGGLVLDYDLSNYPHLIVD
ncbi:DJ-1/PfpI family protein [Nonlabens ponticola]|uniref:Glutamine amidotransferase n=1 Tax=Nonlabens ponticola TaxID=2496866 RepID=A0A3S9MZM5_9FLAO|nr:DJ-1/PfpI family protein [Nonlabens ponticola]AZQ44608.1 glutamine amidotransferase [Nonlabens ponticola]